MSTQSLAPKELIEKWEKYKATDDYQNSFRWAAHEEHRNGSMWAAWIEGRKSVEAELTELTNEVARLRDLMRSYIDFMDENLGTTADWPMEAAFDDGEVCQQHCDLLNAMKREVKPEDIN